MIAEAFEEPSRYMGSEVSLSEASEADVCRAKREWSVTQPGGSQENRARTHDMMTECEILLV